MNEIQTITINGVSYALRDSTAPRLDATLRIAGAAADAEAVGAALAGKQPAGDYATRAELAGLSQLEPLFAETIDGCTDPAKFYVLPDGFIYGFINGEWTNTGHAFVPADYEDRIKRLEDEFELYASNTITDYEYPLTITQGQVITSGGYILTHNDGYFASTAVTPGDKIRVTGFQWTAQYGYALCFFRDSAENLISAYTGVSDDTAETVDLIVPENAATLIVNGYKDMTVSVFGTYTEVFSIKTALDETAQLSAQVAQLQTDVADKASMEYVDDATKVTATTFDYEYPLTITKGKLVYDNGNIHDQASGTLARGAVIPGCTIQVTGFMWYTQYSYSLFHFLDSSGAIIYTHTDPNEGAKVTVAVTVPENASEILINGHIFDCTPSVTGEYRTQVGISELHDEVERLKNTPSYKLITLGDSITMLGTGNTGWVKYFIEKTNCELIANVAMNSAVLSDYSDTAYDGNPQQSNQTNNVLGNQVQKIINNAYEAPDIIMVAIGTNGGISITKEQIRAAYYDDSNALIPLENVDRTTHAGAYRWCLEKLHETYPNAIIFWCTPIMGYQATRSADAAMDYAESLRIATEYTGQIMIDTIRCGINGVNEVNGANGQYLIDGLHPNVNGAKKIGYYNASKVFPFLGNSFELT